MSAVGKTAAAIAAGIAGTQADDAEAGRIFSTGIDAARKFARRVAGDAKAPNVLSDKEALAKHNMTEKQALRRLEADLEGMRRSMKGKSPQQQELIDVKMQERIAGHVHSFTDYDDWSSAMRGMEHNKRNGAGYLTGVDIMYEELRERINPAHWDTLDKYADYRLGPKEKNGELVHMGRRTDNSKDDYFGYRLKDEDYYRKLWGEEGVFQHGATSEPRKSAAQVLAEADAENAARRAQEQAAAAAKREAAETAADKNARFRNGLLGGAAGAGVINSDDSGAANGGLLQPQVQASPTDIGLGPTAEDSLMMEYEGAHDNVRAQPQIMAPQSEALQQFTMGARDLERRLDGSIASLLFPSSGIDYLETVNRPNEDPTWGTRLLGLLDLMP